MNKKDYNLITKVYRQILENDISLVTSNITWKFCHKLKDKLVLAKLESILRFSIPEELKEVIIKYNAGVPNRNKFDKPSKGMVFSGLLSFNKDDQDNVYDMIKSMNSISSKQLLPFGTDGFGNAICINNLGNIVFWDHEQETIKPIAKTFNKFLEMLYK